MEKLYSQARAAAAELIEKSGVKSGDVVIVGCSTSEIIGKSIGENGTMEVAEPVYAGFNDVFSEKGIYIAAQCCEHLNRAVVLEAEKAEALGLERVCAVPYPHAGGSFAAAAYRSMKNPVVVEEIKADAGIDVGRTLIGMHLKRVAVPLRLENDAVGKASVNAAKTRPKFIGGARAKYE